MASICGITIKGLKKFLDHESIPCYQGSLYLGKNKIASWSQDYMGGVYDHIKVEEGYSEEKLYKAVVNAGKGIKPITPSEKEFGREIIPFTLEIALGDLIILMGQEKRYRKAAKAGYAGILEATDGRTICTWNVPSAYADKVFEEYKDELQKVYEEKCKSCPSITDYFTAGNFDLGVPISAANIRLD